MVDTPKVTRIQYTIFFENHWKYSLFAQNMGLIFSFPWNFLDMETKWCHEFIEKNWSSTGIAIRDSVNCGDTNEGRVWAVMEELYENINF